MLLNILLAFYIFTNLIGGERGLVSYYEKNKKLKELIFQEKKLTAELNEFEKKNHLLTNNLNFDYVDMIYREKLKFGKNDEIIIKLK